MDAGYVDRDGRRKTEEREEGENEEPCLWFVRQCKPAFSYHCIVSIVPATTARGVVSHYRGTEEPEVWKRGIGFIRLLTPITIVQATVAVLSRDSRGHNESFPSAERDVATLKGTGGRENRRFLHLMNFSLCVRDDKGIAKI